MEKIHFKRDEVLWEYKGYVVLYSNKQLTLYDINILTMYENMPLSSMMDTFDYYKKYVLHRTTIKVRKEPPDSRVKAEINKYIKEHHVK